jgi:hypothetical protein
MKMKKLNVEELITLISDAIQFRFSEDPTSPGLLVSRLRKGGIYASVLRYEKAFGQGKKVAYKARGTDLLAVLQELAQKVAEDGSDNPLQTLRKRLGS